MTISTKIKNVGILLRISREAGENKDTLLSHRTIAERYCNEREYQYKIYEEIISGGKGISERAELTKLLNDVTTGLFDAVFVVSTDRLSRKLGASQDIADTLADYELPLLTPERSYDLNSNDRLMFDIEGVMASQELRLITKRYRRGKREGSLRGEWVQGISPFGYVKDPKTKKLVIEEKEAKMVRIIFDYALKGYGIATIVNMLIGYRTRSYEVKGGKNVGTVHTGKPFGISHVNTILKNPAYKGTISYQVKNKQKQVTETIVVHYAHEGIVTPHEFQQVQEAVKSRISGGNDGLAKRTRSKGQVITILKDLVYCHCGLKLQFKKDSKQKDTVYLKGCRCGIRGIAEKNLLEYFWEEFINAERLLRKEWEKAMNPSNEDSANEIKSQIDSILSSKNKLLNKLRNSRDSFNEGTFTKEEYLSDKADYEMQIQEIESNIAELNKRLSAVDTKTLRNKYEDKLNWINEVKRLATIRQGKLVNPVGQINIPTISAEDFPEVNRLLKLVIGKIHYRRDDEEIWMDEEGNTEVEKGVSINVRITTR
jgi:site-specific DNA recombinase